MSKDIGNITADNTNSRSSLLDESLLLNFNMVSVELEAAYNNSISDALFNQAYVKLIGSIKNEGMVCSMY
jgi:hypothetical protein